MTGSTTFLLVEDDLNDVFFVEREFEHAPHLRLVHVADGVEAVRYLTGEDRYADREQFPVPNVILLDLKMPRLSGFDFLEWCRTKAPIELRFIPVVVMSSSSLQEDVRRAYALGVNSYMTKPVDWPSFREQIKMLGIYWSKYAETPHAPGR